MRLLVAAILILVPCLAFARTDCRAIEHPDHFEAVCLGDEKAVPAHEQSSVTVTQSGPPESPRTSPESAKPGEQKLRSFSQSVSPDVPTVQKQSATTVKTTPSIPSTPELQGPVVHRQGRQQFQKALEDARASRQKLISDQQQGQ
jgi:hypothetical protein